MMRSRFDEQLELLNNSMISMGALCENVIACAVGALVSDDYAMAEKAMEIEKEIDQKEKEIEGLCLKLLLQQQPVARDLRTISSALKMITDMERIGDQGADIAEIVTYTNLSQNKNSEHITDMETAVIKMVTESINAFVQRDEKLAMEVIAYDDVVDSLFMEVRNDIINMISETAQIREKQAESLNIKIAEARSDLTVADAREKLAVLEKQVNKKSEEAVDILMIAKYLERIGDHATNIAEWVVFSITGERVEGN